MPRLIGWLRACQEPIDCYEFQRYLGAYVYEGEERRAQCSRIIKRLRRGEKRRSRPACAFISPPRSPLPQQSFKARHADFVLSGYLLDGCPLLGTSRSW